MRFFLWACLISGLLLPICADADQIYLTKTEALNLVLGKDCEQSHDPRQITPELLEQLKLKNLEPQPKSQSANFYICKQAGKIKSYALIDNQIGKHLPITYIVGITPSGQVSMVEMLVFREVYGWEARDRKFMAQFENKIVDDNFKLGSTIRHVSGATLSSRAINRGVQRALYLWNKFYKDNQ